MRSFDGNGRLTLRERDVVQWQVYMPGNSAPSCTRWNLAECLGWMVSHGVPWKETLRIWQAFDKGEGREKWEVTGGWAPLILVALPKYSAETVGRTKGIENG